MKTAKVSVLLWSFRKLYSARVIAPLFFPKHIYFESIFSRSTAKHSKAAAVCWAEALDQSMSCHKMGKERRPRRRIFMAFLLQETSQEKKIKWFSSMLTLFSWWFAQNNVTFALYALELEYILYNPIWLIFFSKNHTGSLKWNYLTFNFRIFYYFLLLIKNSYFYKWRILGSRFVL